MQELKQTLKFVETHQTHNFMVNPMVKYKWGFRITPSELRNRQIVKNVSRIVNQKSKPQVENNYKALTRAPYTEKNQKLQLCRQHVPLEALYFGVWWIDSGSKIKCCRKL